jgi:uncharacterized repeat protein (TIGR01451 family)
MRKCCLQLTILAALLVGALAAGCCHFPQYAYRARVIAGPVQPAPAVTLPATPVPVLPGAAPIAPPISVQPLPGSPAAVLPATPQPTLPATPGARVESNLPTRPPLVSAGVALEKLGPAQATVGSLVTYRIEILAASGGARDVIVNDQLAAGLTFANSNPTATLLGNQLEWRLGDLRGGELRTIEVSFRAEQAGSYNNCAVARTAEGQTSQDCVSTTVLAPELDVRVNVEGSDTVMVGQRVTFQITVTNRSNLPASGLLITDRFDDGLEHEAAASPIEKDLGQLAGGQSTTFGVTFRVRHAGRLCNHVDVRGDSGLRGSAEACVTALMAAPPNGAPPADQRLPLPPPPKSDSTPNEPEPQVTAPGGQGKTPAKSGVQVKVLGPSAVQQVDGIAEFSIEVANAGESPLTDLKVVLGQDAALFPVQATDGYQWDDSGKLFWTFPSLAAGKSLRLQLNCRCQNVASKACARVEAIAAEGARDMGEACVEIRRGESQLTMTVSDLSDPATVGKDVPYEIIVTNSGTAPAHKVALLVIVPPEMSIIPLGTMGDRTTWGVDGQNVRFKPVAEIQPDEKIKFRVRVRAQKAGEMKLEAVLQSDGMAEPISKTEKTTVVDGGQ